MICNLGIPATWLAQKSSAPTQAHPVVSTNRDSHPLVGHSENPATLGNFRGLCALCRSRGGSACWSKRTTKYLKPSPDQVWLTSKDFERAGGNTCRPAPRLDAAIHELHSTASEPRAGGRNRLRRPAEQCRSERSFALTIPLAGIRHDQHNEWHESSFSKLSALETLAP